MSFPCARKHESWFALVDVCRRAKGLDRDKFVLFMRMQQNIGPPNRLFVP